MIHFSLFVPKIILQNHQLTSEFVLYTMNQQAHNNSIDPSCVEWLMIVLIFYFLAITLKYVALTLWEIIKSIWPEVDLEKRYAHKGKQSWAVVTGATDGIGLGFCQQLVAKGFNVCLISRNQSKLNTVVQRIQSLQPQQYKSKKIISIQFDFTQTIDKDKLANLLNSLDKLHITMLVNNVGIALIKQFDRCEYQQCVDLVSVNCHTMALLNAYLIKRVQKSKSQEGGKDGRYAIINLSSLAGYNPIPYISLYSSTKAFNRFISQGLSIEYGEIDILSICPMHVESGGSNVKKQFNIPTSRQCARDSLKQLRFGSYASLGYLSHCITGSLLLTYLPKFLLRIFTKKEMRKLVDKYYTKKE